MVGTSPSREPGKRIALGEVTPESLLEVREVYDTSFLGSKARDGARAAK
ncbi:hypothetical protein [Streptomyces sp. NPDC059651]